MPALDESSQLAPITAPIGSGPYVPQFPSPSIDGLRLERPSPKELAGSASGRRFAIDTPYMVVWSGWGEWFPATD